MMQADPNLAFFALHSRMLPFAKIIQNFIFMQST